MTVSGFTIARNITKYNYPVKEAILSILPVCDEFIVNVGESEDNTLDIIKSINSPKIKIIEREWDDSLGKYMLSAETNFAMSLCRGAWCFYVQADEMVHENDLSRLRKYMFRYINDDQVDGFRFRWLHFYGSFYRYRVDAGWFQKQVRIIRNNGMIMSNGDAWEFIRKDGKPLTVIKTLCYIYHYGWVHTPKAMSLRKENAQDIGYAAADKNKRTGDYNFGDLNRFPVYFGTHPKVMDKIVKNHKLSKEDWFSIKKQYFFNPLLWFRVRYKTFKRFKKPIK